MAIKKRLFNYPMIVSFFSINVEDIEDPAFPSLWYINNTGTFNMIPEEDINLIPIWKLYDGLGKTISVADRGCYLRHSDFSAKTKTSSNFNTIDNSTNVNTGDNTNGTAALGVAAATSDKFGTIGVAPKASVCCSVFSGHLTESTAISLISKNSNSVDVKLLPQIKANFNKPRSIQDAMQNSHQIFVTGSGDFGHRGLDSNELAFACSPFTITVGSSTGRGAPAFYTGLGACVTINSPGGGGSTEIGGLSDDPKFPSTSEQGDLTDVYGTQYSAAQVAGVVALMLQARPDLTYRDIQAILMLTATINDPKSAAWQQNSAQILFHSRHGFGRLDASLAVVTAQEWKLLPPLMTEETKIVKTSKIPHFPDDSLYIDFYIGQEISCVEYVEVSIQTEKETFTKMRVTLVSPGHTHVVLLRPPFEDEENELDMNQTTFTLGSRFFFGENAKGKWTLVLSQTTFFGDESVTEVSLTVYGSKLQQLPKFSRRKASPSEIIDVIDPHPKTPNITIGEIECSKSANLTMHGPSPWQIDDLPLILFDPQTNGSTEIGSVDWKDGGIHQMKIPCMYPNSHQYILSLRNELLGQSVSAECNVANREAAGIQEPLDEQIVQIDENGTINTRWTTAVKTNRNNGYAQKVIVELWDEERAELIQSDCGFNLGAMTLHVPFKSIEKAVITVIPIDENTWNDVPLFVRFSIQAGPPQKKKGLSAAAITAIVIGTGVLVVLCIIGGYWWYSKRKQPSNYQIYSTTGALLAQHVAI